MSRLDSRIDESLIARIHAIDASLRELKVGNQYLEAEMHESTSASSYDLTGSMVAVGGAGFVEAVVVVTATSADGVTPFLSSCAPEWWIPNMSSPFEQNYSTSYDITSGVIPAPDGLSVRFWYNVGSRAATSASTFYFKYHVYATVPVNVSVVRAV